MKALVNIFLKGLVFTLPLIITFGLIYWVFNASESLLKIPLQWLLPDGAYVTGMGVISLLVIIFVCGILVQAYLIKHVFRWLESMVENIPIVKTLYGSSRELLNFVAGNKSGEMKKVVMVTFDGDVRLMGFVTKENVVVGKDELIAVYLPMSLQMGGYLVYLPKSRCEFMDIPVQKAMQQVLTAHMTSREK